MQQITRKKINGRVNLTCVSTPKFKRTVLRLALLLPLGGENAALYAALPHVLRRGTAQLPDLRAVGAALDELYGARIEALVKKQGETLALGFIADCIDEQYASGADGLTAKVVRFLTQLLYEPALSDGIFRAEDTEGEKINLLARIAALENDPRLYANYRLTELMCEKERYGFSALGTAEQAEKITPETLYLAYRDILQKARIELFYCGPMQPDIVEALFTDTPLSASTGTVSLPKTEIISYPTAPPREIIEDKKVVQGKLALGFRTGGASLWSGDPAAYWVFQTLYGNSTSSKLFLNVREKKSLCYYANAQFIPLKGLLLVCSGIENKNFKAARDEILRQLELCRQGEISEMELENARGTLQTNWRVMLDDPLALENYWLGQAVVDTLVAPEERIEQLSVVTREQVARAAQNTVLDTVYFMKGGLRE